jgi:hypothetical protein
MVSMKEAMTAPSPMMKEEKSRSLQSPGEGQVAPAPAAA